jgi:hypothetical protein
MPPDRFAPQMFNKRTIPAVNAGSCGRTKKVSRPRLREYREKQGRLVPGNEKRDNVGHGGVADPPRVRMSEPRWCKSRAMETTMAMAFEVRV